METPEPGLCGVLVKGQGSSVPSSSGSREIGGRPGASVKRQGHGRECELLEESLKASCFLYMVSVRESKPSTLPCLYQIQDTVLPL